MRSLDLFYYLRSGRDATGYKQGCVTGYKQDTLPRGGMEDALGIRESSCRLRSDRRDAQ